MTALRDSYPNYVISKNKYDYDYVDKIMNLSKDTCLKEQNSFENFNILNISSKCIHNIINDIDISLDTASHSMIKYWMIYVNQIMCNEVKTIYRYNPVPQNNKFELLSKYSELDLKSENRDSIISFIKNNSNNLTSYLIKCLLTKAFYSTYLENETHYGVGINNYTHWTSPIRRSCDLLNHCILRGYKIESDMIKLYIKYMNEMEKIQDDIENFIIQFNIYKNIKMNDLFEASIIGISKTGINIFIEDLDNKFSIHISKLSNDILNYDNNNKILKLLNGNIIYKLFDKINVKVSKVDTYKIDFIVFS